MAGPPITHQVAIAAREATLTGLLSVPAEPLGVVLFAHGTGSGRLSPRNQYVAGELVRGGLATLLVDLLTRAEEVEEARTGHLRFDIELLADRLLGCARWLGDTAPTAARPLGYFGASTGAAAALVAAAAAPDHVFAVVSRGGRPDLAGPALERVRAPTLLIVGGDDVPVIALNRTAYAALRGERELRIVPGATHLFEEAGTLEQVAELASDWFVRHLPFVSRR